MTVSFVIGVLGFLATVWFLSQYCGQQILSFKKMLDRDTFLGMGTFALGLAILSLFVLWQLIYHVIFILLWIGLAMAFYSFIVEPLIDENAENKTIDKNDDDVFYDYRDEDDDE